MRNINTKSVSHTIFQICVILVGELIASFAINVFIVPHKLLSGGVWGIALLLNYKLDWPVYLLVFLMNVPLFVFGLIKLGRRFILLTGVSIAASTLFLWLTSVLLTLWNIVLEVQNPVLAAVIGGALVGLGSGMVLRQGSSTGGTDIIAIVLHRRFSFPIGAVSTVINIVIIAVMAIFFGLEPAMFTLVSIFVSNRTLDIVQEGFNRRKTVLIISDKMDQIVPRVLTELNRGATLLKGEGAYTGGEKNVLYSIINTMQLAKMKEIILSVDPHAFFSIIDTKEVIGRGFYEKEKHCGGSL
jgi:uncharacterized membrane-anchored protein YitT (DUF2179 family)